MSMSRLQTHFVVLTDKLDLDKIIPYLRQDRMLTNNEYEILTNPVYKPSQRRAKLLNMMLRKGKNHFEHFGNSLVWSGQTELALHIGVNVDSVPPSPYKLDPEVTCDPYDQMRQLLWNVLPGVAAPIEPPPPPYNPQALPARNSTCSPPVCPQQPVTASAPHQLPDHTQGSTSATTSEGEADVPRVFILYCKDTTLEASHGITHSQFCEKVLQLADFLHQCGGIECSIDQYEGAPQSNWNQWTQDKIRQSRFVILVLSPLLNKQLLSGTHTCVDMKTGMFFSDAVVNSICAPKFVPVFLSGCEPISGNIRDWIPPGLVMSRYFRLQNLDWFNNDIVPSEADEMSPGEIFQCLSAVLREPKNENLAEIVQFLRGRQGVARPDPPRNPVHVPSPGSSPSPRRHLLAHGL